MRRLLLLALAGLVLAGASTSAAANRMQAAPRLAVSSSKFGKILFDGRRRAIYAFTRDGRGRSTCYGACAAAWPPYIVARKPLAGAGVRKALIGTVRRRDGRLQATYAGRPLYFYVGDRSPGQVSCQNVAEFGGTWLVVRGSGRLVRYPLDVEARDLEVEVALDAPHHLVADLARVAQLDHRAAARPRAARAGAAGT